MEALPGIIAAAAVVICGRVFYLIYKIFTSDCRMDKGICIRTAVCIGSGGHTTEILRIIKNLDIKKYQPRYYIVAQNDLRSEAKIHEAENKGEDYSLIKIPRSRNVKQSYFTSVISTIYAILYSIPVVYNLKPDVIFCNGPGTCIPICIVAFALRCLFILDCRIVFIESICRVRTLSLSGKILQYFADVFVVQWPQLREACFRAKYFGRLV